MIGAIVYFDPMTCLNVIDRDRLIWSYSPKWPDIMISVYYDRINHICCNKCAYGIYNSVCIMLVVLDDYLCAIEKNESD